MEKVKGNIVLIGMPGCGKTTIGELISQNLNYKFYDMDKYIEEISGKTVKELFNEGEEYFREWETTACKELSDLNNVIIASGGGVVKKSENIDILKKSCTVIFIDRPVEEIVKDIEVNTRPLLKEGISKVYSLYNERYELYKSAADKIVENKGPLDEVIKSCQDIVL